jgi:hypothetical protein
LAILAGLLLQRARKTQQCWTIARTSRRLSLNSSKLADGSSCRWGLRAHRYRKDLTE